VKLLNSEHERTWNVEVSEKQKLVEWALATALQCLFLLALAGLEGSALSRMVGQ